jgi:hypothetical protein
VSAPRSYSLALTLVAALAVTGCGSGGNPASAGKSIGGVQACLENAGYGVTVVPTSELTTGGPENRGPGQTGELLIGRTRVRPTIGSDNADAVVAFWKSAQLARDSPNVQAKGLGMHADALGTVTVQPTPHLVLQAIKAAKTPAARGAVYLAQVGKIESCVG